jgi:hypothetical protein
MPYFTTEELRALPDMDDVTRFPDARLVAAHDWIVSIIERECETSFIAREVTARLNGPGRDALDLGTPYVLSVDALAVDGADYATDVVSTLLWQDGFLYQSDGAYWPATSRGNITITYTAGYSTEPPGDLKEAALRGARHWLLTMDAWSGVDERTTSMTSDYGTTTVMVADDKHPTGLPFVDATINAWARRVRVPKVS